MNKLPILYARGNNGKVLEWQIETDGNKFRMITGQQDGKKVESEWTICEGKNVGRSNETNPTQQAEAEALAKWEKKLKHGGYWESVKDIDQSKFVEPMLAKNLKDRLDKIDWKKGVIVQNKFNGFRCIATFDGTSVSLFSRKGETYISVPHINRDLQRFFEKYPDAILDGELFNNDLRQQLNEISKLVRKTKHVTAEDLKRSEEMVQYFVYDGYNMTDKTGQEVGYSTRKAWIDENLPKFSKFYRPVKSTTVYSMKEVDEIFGEYVKDGQEGVIIRIPDSAYENKRSSLLLKYKPLESDEAVIINIQEGTGNWSGVAKIVTFEWKGKTFDGTLMGTYERAKEILNNKKKWIGQTVTFKYNGLTGLGVPNYARLDPENCFEGPK